jgi:hypothetical protein
VSKGANIVLNQYLNIMETLVAFIALFATIFGIMYVHYTTRNKERMALIEKGADASLFNTGREGMKWSFNWNKFTLKVGMLFYGNRSRNYCRCNNVKAGMALMKMPIMLLQ